MPSAANLFHLMRKLLAVFVILSVGSCSKDDQPPASGAALTYTSDGKSVSLFSVKDDIWPNQNEESAEVQLTFVADPLFRDKTTNANLMIYLSRLKGPGTYPVGKDYTTVYYSANGSHQTVPVGSVWWEASEGSIVVTDWSSSGIKGRFEASLVRKKIQGTTVVVVPGTPMVMKGGTFSVRF